MCQCYNRNQGQRLSSNVPNATSTGNFRTLNYHPHSTMNLKKYYLYTFYKFIIDIERERKTKDDRH